MRTTITRRTMLLGSLGVLAVPVLGCGAPSRAAETPPDLRGAITAVTRLPNTASGSEGAIVQIDEETGPQPRYGKAAVRIAAATRLSEERAGHRRPVTTAALVPGQRVVVWLTGPVAESYPVQATARELVILPTA